MAAKKAALGLWLPLALLGVWELLTTLRVLDPLFFPAPSTLTTTAGQMLRHGDLIDQVRSTLGRMLIGFLAGSAAGLVCGLLMGGISAIGRSLEPLISAVYATPNLTLLPMLMLFFGVGDTAGLILIATGCFLLVTVHALDAVRRVNHHYIEMAANYGADRLAIFRRVYFPACLPGIATGIRLALGRALVITISVELVSASTGLGSMIWLAWQTFATERLYIGVLTTAALGLAFNLALRRVEARLIPWAAQAGPR